MNNQLHPIARAGHQTQLSMLCTMRGNLRRLICWMEHDRSLDADRSRILSLKQQLEDAEVRIFAIRHPVHGRSAARRHAGPEATVH